MRGMLWIGCASLFAVGFFSVPVAQAHNQLFLGADIGQTFTSNGSAPDFGVSGGYRLSRYADIDLNYKSIPHYEMTVVSGSVLGRYKLSSRFNLLGRIGAAYWNESPLGTQNATGWNPLVGLGVSYRVNRHISARLQYQMILHSGSGQLGGSLDTVSLGAIFHF